MVDPADCALECCGGDWYEYQWLLFEDVEDYDRYLTMFMVGPDCGPY